MVFDDFSHVLENRAIRYLWHPRVFFESEHSRSRPLPYVTFAISYALSGFSLSGLRSWSLLFHLGSGVLVGALYRRWLGGLNDGAWGALLAGSIFLLHPLAADAVIYFSARGSVLVLFFLLLALWFHGREKQGPLVLAGFFAASIAAFLSREAAIALFPLLLLVHRIEKRSWRSLLPFVAPLLLGGLALFWLKAGFLGAAYRGFFTVQGDVDVTGPLDFLRLSLSLWPKLLALFVQPTSQSIDHQVFLPDSWFDTSVLAGIFLWLMFAVCLGQAWRSRSFGWLAPCWFFLALLPTNSVLPLLDPFAERHFYLALPAFAWGVAWLFAKVKGEAAMILLTMLLAAYFTLPRVEQWRKPTELWLDAHRKAPGKFRVAYNSAVSLMVTRDDSQGALALLGGTYARLQPGDLTYEQQEEGLRTAASALASLSASRLVSEESLLAEFPPGFWRELLLLKATMQKNPKTWHSAWKAALTKVEMFPLSGRARDPQLVRNSFLLLKAEQLERSGREKEAAEVYEQVILPFQERHFPYWTAREALGDLYMSLGRDELAIEQFEKAAYQYKVFKRFPFQLQSKLYELYLKHGDLPRASDSIGELVRVYTDNAKLRRLYADLLAAQQDRHAARQALEAEFYSGNAISPTDEREIIRP